LYRHQVNFQSTSRTKAAAKPPTVARAKARGIQSVVIGFRVLEKIAEATGPLALKDLVAGTGMAASKLRFYLVSFLELGLVSQDPASGYYSLGPGAVKLGVAALEKVDVVRTSRFEMMELAETLGYTVFLAVWGTHGPTVVDRVDGRSRTVLEIRVGSVMPVSASAVGWVFSAFMPKAATATLLKREAKEGIAPWGSSNDSGASLAELQREIRRTRLATAPGTLLTGFTAVASPILDRSQSPLAVISVIGPIGRMDDSPKGAVAKALGALTDRLSRQIGWVPLPAE
jgi:DNA-binding IclR family transcriptional regulator